MGISSAMQLFNISLTKKLCQERNKNLLRGIIIKSQTIVQSWMMIQIQNHFQA